ncbi:52 kDa repressor of the inhibitor of the protein kinase-like isoform X3 [Aphis craccivora]|uniref:52 kDa repressor of the inhibitor of the protein kinase-like isoform X3 n=1 Tax=Aphis craccivora TaxID=307492 RepID=A0A6G0ZCT4_APHCR|nr:52 kDa repressor of the inhibitor of the protein kinase-like isoform X3 [Aphis craccivora]
MGQLLSFRNLLEFYTPRVDSNNTTSELKLRKVKLSMFNVVPKTSLEAFLQCDSSCFPNINKLCIKNVMHAFLFRQRPLTERFQNISNQIYLVDFASGNKLLSHLMKYTEYLFKYYL